MCPRLGFRQTVVFLLPQKINKAQAKVTENAKKNKAKNKLKRVITSKNSLGRYNIPYKLKTP